MFLVTDGFNFVGPFTSWDEAWKYKELRNELRNRLPQAQLFHVESLLSPIPIKELVEMRVELSRSLS